MYIAVEIKEKADKSVEISTFKKDTREEAEKAFHSILAVAAVSTHPVHSALILNVEGATLKKDCYKHEQPKPEPEDEEEKEGEPEQEGETVEEDSTEEQKGGEG